MHISEGVLNTQMLIATNLVGVIALSFSIKKTDFDDIAKTAVLSAVFFLGSFIHIPIGVSSVHLLLCGLIGAFIGISSIFAIFIALILQALMFGYGGFSTLGANICILGSACLVGRLIFTLKIEKLANLRYFLVGFFSVLSASLILSIILALNGKDFLKISYLAFASNIPIMILEGIISLFALKFINKVAPKYLRN